MGDARLDLTDLYAFPKPGDAGKSILIMNLHPSVGENPRGPTTAEPFAPEALSACMECDPKSNVIITVLHAHSSNGRRYRRQRDGRRHRPRHGIHDQPLILVLEDAEMAGARRRGGRSALSISPAAEIVV
jgi:hypothetical protein